MATTTTANVIVPEVYEDLTQAAFLGQVRVLPAATQSDTLVGVPGDTVHFPKWNTLGELDDLTENVAMTTEALGQSESTATIKEAGKAVEITDSASLNGLGDPQSEAIRQFGILVARKIDSDLITAATAAGGLTAPLAANTAITWGEVVGGIAEFGDEWEPNDFSGLYIRSELFASIMKDDQFLQAYAGNGGNTVIQNGRVGTIGGVPVVLSNRLDAAAPAVLIKNGALGALYKRRPIVEQDRDILKRTTVITTNVHYAVKRLNDKGVVTFKVGG